MEQETIQSVLDPLDALPVECDGFAQVARNETDLEVLTAELVAVVQTTMQRKSVGVWLRPVERKGAGAQKDPT